MNTRETGSIEELRRNRLAFNMQVHKACGFILEEASRSGSSLEDAYRDFVNSSKWYQGLDVEVQIRIYQTLGIDVDDWRNF